MDIFDFKTPPPPRRIEIALVPMINVVFLLMIFFLVVGSVESSVQADMKLPNAYTGEHRYTPDDIRALTITLGADNVVKLNNVRVVSDSLFRMALQQHIGKNPDIPITVLADAQANATLLVALVTQISQAGAKNLTIATERL